MNVYTIEDSDVLFETELEIIHRPVIDPIHIHLENNGKAILAVSLLVDGQPYDIPEGAICSLEWVDKSSNNHILYSLGKDSVKSNTLYFRVDNILCASDGQFNPLVSVMISGEYGFRTPRLSVVASATL